MRNLLIGLVLIALLGVGVIITGCNETLDITGLTTTTTSTTTTTTLPKVSAPTFVLPAGIYETDTFITITIEAGTMGADSIYYETDGSTPTATSTLYAGSFTIEASKTIEAIAVKSGYQNSDVATADYEIWWWQAVGNGVNSSVRAIALGSIYAGGTFTSAGGVAVNRIAKWTGATWEALGGGTDDLVSGLVFGDSDNLYAGGSFTNPANYIARWNGSAWAALGTGVDGSINCLAFDNSGYVYAGGNFGTASGVTSVRFARWNIAGSTWEAINTQLSSGGSEYPKALAVDAAGNVYFAGNFTNGVGGNSDTAGIAMWNPVGLTWEALGTGVNGTVNALAIDGSNNVYAAGSFSQASGITVNNIAKWNGSSWSALGSGSGGGGVKCLAVDDQGNLYAGGDFNVIGGVTVQYIGKWDGTNWSAIGGGIGSEPSVLAVDENGSLYAGGGFSEAGGIPASNLAKWGRK